MDFGHLIGSQDLPVSSLYREEYHDLIEGRGQFTPTPPEPYPCHGECLTPGYYPRLPVGTWVWETKVLAVRDGWLPQIKMHHPYCSNWRAVDYSMHTNPTTGGPR